jgi:hypothetical protein
VVYVVPDLDSVVVFVSTTETGGSGLRELIGGHIVPAIQAAGTR